MITKPIAASQEDIDTILNKLSEYPFWGEQAKFLAHTLAGNGIGVLERVAAGYEDKIVDLKNQISDLTTQLTTRDTEIDALTEQVNFLLGQLTAIRDLTYLSIDLTPTQSKAEENTSAKAETANNKNGRKFRK